MAITVVTDLAAKAFLNNPINLRLTSNRSIDFDNAISAIANNSGHVRFSAALIAGSPGQNLIVGDTVRFDGFTEADNLYLNDVVCSVTAITTGSPNLIDTDAVYSTSETVTGSPKYYRENANFEIKSTVKLKFGSGGTFASILGPTSKSIDGVNFDFDVAKYLKLLYDENVGSNETTAITIPITGSNYYTFYDLPIGQIDFAEYFDDPDGLQKTGSTGNTSAQYLHDGCKMPNDLSDKSNIFIEGTDPNIVGIALSNIKYGLSKEYFAAEFVTFINTVNIKILTVYKNGSSAGSTITAIANKKLVMKQLTAYLSPAVDPDYIYVTIYKNGAPFTIYYEGYFYFDESNFRPGYLVKFKNDLGGWEILNCGLVERSLEIEKSDWEKKLTFPYTSTDYGSKNTIQRSDDILELTTGTLAYEEELASFWESEFVHVYDITNAKNMHGQLLEDKAIIRTHDSIRAQFKIKLNRRK